MLLMCLAALGLACQAEPRLTQRVLHDIGHIGVPAAMSDDNPAGFSDNRPDRISFSFSSSYFWASMGSVMAYRQRLIVSLMAPDATADDYQALPDRWRFSYAQRRVLPSRSIGSGTLATTEGVYQVGGVSAPAFQFLYTDRARRLQLVWHTIQKEVDLATGIAQVGRMAESLRIVRDPVARWAELRNAPRQEAEARAAKRAAALAMRQREGLGTLPPGQPVQRDGVYVAWMAEPEPRYQLLLPLGRVRAAPGGAVGLRPRPVGALALQALGPMAGSLVWREFSDGQWAFSSWDNAYLPFDGISAQLAVQQQDPGFVYFYLVATVRVEEEQDPRRLASLAWFFDGVPEMRRRWQAGQLVTPGRAQ